MLRAEILAEGVREELPQPLVSAAPAETGVRVHELPNFHVTHATRGEFRSLTFGAIEGEFHALSYRGGWEGQGRLHCRVHLVGV